MDPQESPRQLKLNTIFVILGACIGLTVLGILFAARLLSIEVLMPLGAFLLVTTALQLLLMRRS